MRGRRCCRGGRWVLCRHRAASGVALCPAPRRAQGARDSRSAFGSRRPPPRCDPSKEGHGPDASSMNGSLLWPAGPSCGRGGVAPRVERAFVLARPAPCWCQVTRRPRAPGRGVTHEAIPRRGLRIVYGSRTVGSCSRRETRAPLRFDVRSVSSVHHGPWRRTREVAEYTTCARKLPSRAGPTGTWW